MELLAAAFRPEFINRIDEIIVFRALDGGAARRDHAGCCSTGSRGGCAPSGSRSSSPTRRSSCLAHEGYDPEFGARPLRRTIQRLVENELSRMVLDRTRSSPGDKRRGGRIGGRSAALRGREGRGAASSCARPEEQDA